MLINGLPHNFVQFTGRKLKTVFKGIVNNGRFINMSEDKYSE